MPIRYRLPRELVEELNRTSENVKTFAQEERDKAEGMSERWQEGERCEALLTWLDSLEEAADAMDLIEETAL